MEPTTRFELVTYRLRIDCTTTVLRRRKGGIEKREMPLWANKSSQENAGFSVRQLSAPWQ
jgi:hypothetical protein